jgi:hypothetical protein
VSFALDLGSEARQLVGLYQPSLMVAEQAIDALAELLIVDLGHRSFSDCFILMLRKSSERSPQHAFLRIFDLERRSLVVVSSRLPANARGELEQDAEPELIITMYKTWEKVLGPSFDRQTS